MCTNIAEFRKYLTDSNFSRYTIKIGKTIKVICDSAYVYLAPDSLFFKNDDGNSVFLEYVRGIKYDETISGCKVRVIYGVFKEKHAEIICEHT
mgnify:CR=1 FL=1